VSLFVIAKTLKLFEISSRHFYGRKISSRARENSKIAAFRCIAARVLSVVSGVVVYYYFSNNAVTINLSQVIQEAHSHLLIATFCIYLTLA